MSYADVWRFLHALLMIQVYSFFLLIQNSCFLAFYITIAFHAYRPLIPGTNFLIDNVYIFCSLFFFYCCRKILNKRRGVYLGRHEYPHKNSSTTVTTYPGIAMQAIIDCPSMHVCNFQPRALTTVLVFIYGASIDPNLPQAF